MSNDTVKFELSIDRLSEHDRKLIEEQPDRYKEIVLSRPIMIMVKEITMADTFFSQLNNFVADIEEKVSDPNLTKDGLERVLHEEFQKPYVKEQLKQAIDKIRGSR